MALHIHGTSLTKVQSTKYLGIQISSDLSWSPQIKSICTKTRKLTGLLYRRFYKFCDCSTLLTLFITCICPHLEYCSCVWDPYLIKDIEALESAQKFALKICSKSWTVSYRDLLGASKIQTLQSRREQTILVYMFKLVNNFVDHPNAPIQHKTFHHPSRTSNPLPLKLQHCRTTKCLNSYFPRTASAWNSLAADTVNYKSVSSFKCTVKL